MPHEFNRGLNQSIADIKIKHNTKIPWGTLYVEVSQQSPSVLQFAWKDANVVLFMTTVHDCTSTTTRTRKRPKNSDALTKRTWGEAFEKDLPIPDAIHGYNMNMNGVDLADQGRAECPTGRRTNLTWKPCFNFIFDTALCNMAKLWDACGHYSRSKRGGLHFTFRTQLACKLIAKSKARTYVVTPGIQPGTRTVLASVLKEACVDTTSTHCGELVKGKKQNTCKACQAGSRVANMREKKRPRVVLAEVSANTPKPRAPRTSYSCSECLVSLCQSEICWQDHINAYNSNN